MHTRYPQVFATPGRDFIAFRDFTVGIHACLLFGDFIARVEALFGACQQDANVRGQPCRDMLLYCSFFARSIMVFWFIAIVCFISLISGPSVARHGRGNFAHDSSPVVSNAVRAGSEARALLKP